MQISAEIKLLMSLYKLHQQLNYESTDLLSNPLLNTIGLVKNLVESESILQTLKALSNQLQQFLIAAIHIVQTILYWHRILVLYSYMKTLLSFTQHLTTLTKILCFLDYSIHCNKSVLQTLSLRALAWSWRPSLVFLKFCISSLKSYK